MHIHIIFVYGDPIKNQKAFGYELLLDLYDCKHEICDNIDICYDYLDEMVDFIDMKKQAPPAIFRTDDTLFPDKAGLSGWVALVESSIVIHTLSKTDFISIDIYSCKKFSPTKAIEFTKRFVIRGKQYYSHKKA